MPKPNLNGRTLWEGLSLIDGSPIPAGTAHCAASAERGAKTTCERCTLCDGASANVVINAHGKGKGKLVYN